MKNLLKPSLDWLFAFIPVAFFLEYSHASAPLVFFSAALSIIPVAKLIGHSTEQLATYTGDAVGGLLNATFGNFPELVIAVIALAAGLHDIVLASLAGAILANLLLAMGVSFLVGGVKFHNQDYNPTSIRVYSSMMMLAVISLTIPSGYHIFTVEQPSRENENTLNLLLAMVLLTAYVLYLVFMIKTHPDFFRSEGRPRHEKEHDKRWSMSRALITLLAASVLAAVMSEVLVGAAEETGKVLGMSSVFIGIIFLAVVGGAAESISAVSMAAKNKMDLSIGIALGSSIQIALFVAPLLVILSVFIGPGQLHLAFPKAMIIALLLSVILAAMVAGDGRSNWYKGVQLIMVYVILGMLLYFIPVV
ncbi:MAG TPA: calcium/proton exchanger [Cyclobacteriaceae bacterium]|nr:calcium/proton exchanger [Cyclobacteriaceae bacterium]